MKRFLLAGATLLALTAAQPAVAQPMPAFNWSGFYIGAHVGYGWADKFWSEAGISDGSHTASGFLGGGQIGFNWQTGPWVLGVEGQFSWADLGASHTEPAPGDLSSLRTKIDSLGTLAGRIGYAWNNQMFYVKGGWAWAHDKYSDFSTTGVLFGAASETRSGWMVGVGWEHGFTPNWSVKIEYNYMDFGSKTLEFTGGTDGTIYDIGQRIQLVKLGINYRFGGM